MPLGGCQNPNGAIYATVDVSKKKKHAEPSPLPAAPTATQPSSNYMNLEPVAEVPAAEVGKSTTTADKNYMNLEFSESLCLYENAKNVLTKAGLQQAGGNACNNCGHQKQRCSENGSGGGGGGERSNDYMTMEPVNGRMAAEVKRNLFPGYLPMCPAGAGSCNSGKQRDMLKNIMNKGLAEKSASIPSLNEYNKLSTEAAADGFVPVYRNKNLSGLDEPRKRSSSAGSSTRYDDELQQGPGELSEQSSRRTAVTGSNDTSSSSSSAESMSSRRVVKTCPDASSSGVQSDDSGFSGAAVVRDGQQTALVHIRRSSSVPCKNNRDSSSSNDSGVSTGSLRYRGADFAEFELPLTTAMSTVRHKRTATAATSSHHSDGDGARPGGCVHGSLPRRSKSTDRLRELGFRFQKFADPMKSSSAGAEVPVCLRRDKGQLGTVVVFVVAGVYKTMNRGIIATVSRNKVNEPK